MVYQEQSESVERLLTLVGARWFILVLLTFLVFGVASGGAMANSEILLRVGIIFIAALVATFIEWALIHGEGMAGSGGLRFVQGLHLVLLGSFITVLLWFSGTNDLWLGVLFVLPIIESGFIVGLFGVLITTLFSIISAWIFTAMVTFGSGALLSNVLDGLIDQRVFEAFLPYALLFVAIIILSSIGSFAWRRELATLYHERQSAYSLLVELDEGVVMYDDRLVVRYINPSAERILGVQRRDIIGHTAGRLVAIAAPGVDNLSRVLLVSIDGVSAETIELSDPDRTLLVVQRSLFSSKGEPLGFVRLMRDVTQEQRVGKLKSEFISVAAHQLRTPLSGVRWAIEELKDDPALSGPQRTAVLQAGEAVNRTITLVNELLDVARIEEGRFDYEFKEGQLSPMVNEVVRELTAKSKEKGVVLEFTPPSSDLPMISMDVEKLRMAVEVLVDNAINYTPADGHVLVEISRDHNEIVLKVEDTGVGVPKDQQDRVFTKFFRGDNVVRLQTEGSGLGLFIAKNVVERHKGRIWFESDKGTGARFFIALPIGVANNRSGENA